MLRTGLITVALLSGVAVGDNSLTVQTKYGAVTGRVNTTTGSHYFFGIPYAAPPVGSLRYAPPAAPTSWNETKVLGEQPGPICAQSNSGGSVQGQEDCLTLAVYTPANASGLPVLAWIYGGGFVTGSNDWGNQYNGDSFATNQNVIVVAMNYRLGSLGFLALSGLMDEHGTTGNYGLLDQQFALKWINENIAAFGGDPNKVTIFGESAGAASVVGQLTMPASQPYFRAAIAESALPVGDIPWVSYGNAIGFGQLFAEYVGCENTTTQLECMRSLPVTKALEPELDWRKLYPSGIKEYAPKLMPVMPYFPVVDGTAVPLAPVDLAQAGRWPDKPFIIGTNKDEGTIFSPSVPLIVNAFPPVVYPVTQYGFNKTLLHFFNATTANAAAAFYTPIMSSYTDGINQIIRDYIFACPTRNLLRTILAHSPNRTAPLYTYQFRPYLYDGAYGDFHGAEIPFVFNHTDPREYTADLVNLAYSMHSLWASLARDGTPHCSSCPAWTPYTYNPTTGNDTFMAFDIPSSNEANLLKDACDFWDKFGYQQNPSA